MCSRKYLLALALVAGCVSADQSGRYEPQQVSGQELLSSMMSDALEKEESKVGLAPSTEWEKAIEESAFSYGAQAGAYWQSRNILNYFTSIQRILDEGVKFEPLLISKDGYKIQPPVIMEDDGREVISPTGKTLRVLDKTFNIGVDARFVYGSKNWREYLYLIPEKPVIPHRSMRPKSDRDKQIWDSAIKRGWETGVKSVIYTVRTRYARMVRDYVGMTRYHLLRHYNMVTMPIVSEKYEAVTGTNKIMNINDRVITIDAVPVLNHKKNTWIAFSKLPQTSGLFPRGIEDQSVDISDIANFAGHLQPKFQSSEMYK